MWRNNWKFCFVFSGKKKKSFAGKEKIFKHGILTCFLQMRLRFKVSWMRIGQVIKLWNVIDFSKKPCTSQMISIFLKCPVYLNLISVKIPTHTVYKNIFFYCCVFVYIVFKVKISKNEDSHRSVNTYVFLFKFLLSTVQTINIIIIDCMESFDCLSPFIPIGDHTW